MTVTARRPPASGSAHRWGGALQREAAAGWLMAAPALIGLLLFIAVPFAIALGVSFTHLRLGSPLPARFVGLEQYRRVLSDPAFHHALVNNALFAFAAVPVQVALALGAALLLNRAVAGIAVLRTLFFMPVVFPMALVAVVWTLIYAPGPNGLMNAALSGLTLGAWEPHDFLHQRAWALPALMLLAVWQGMGFQMVILLAGLQAIPAELYEAAALDGAGAWARLRHVTLPQLRNPLIFVTLVTMIFAFRLFDPVQIMTRGGPRDATTTVVYEAVRAVFERQQAGWAGAATVIFFAIVLAITLIQRRLLRQRREMD